MTLLYPSEGATLLRPEELRSTHDLKLVALSLNGSSPHHEGMLSAEELEVNGDGPRFSARRNKWGELVLKGINPHDPAGPPAWVKVIKLPPTAQAPSRDGDGWLARPYDRPTFALSVPIRPFRWRRPGPRQTFLARLRELEKSLKQAEASAQNPGATIQGAKKVVAIRQELEDLKAREKERVRVARRQSARKRPPKTERLLKRKGVTPSGGKSSRKGKKKDGDKKGGRNKKSAGQRKS